MPDIFDQNYLIGQQYKSSANLEARIALHRDYGTNPVGWFKWLYDQLPIQPGKRILDIGCGSGDLWYENLHRSGADIELYLGDVSTGMLQRAHSRIRNGMSVTVICADAQAIPIVNNVFDIILANHMLYHVPDIAQALCELHRILKPGAFIMAATNGNGHMKELYELLEECTPGFQKLVSQVERFSLENAKEQLGKYFSSVDQVIYPEALKVTDPEALIAYIQSMWHGRYASSQIDQIRSKVIGIIQNHGYFLIHKSQGLITARK